MDLPNKTDSAPDPERPKQEQIVETGGVVKAKRPATRRFFDYMFAESPKSLGASIGREVVVPRIKTGLRDALVAMVDGMLFGAGGNPLAGTSVGRTIISGGGVAYNQMSNPQNALQQAAAANQARNSGNYEDLVCTDQLIAEKLLAHLIECINSYNRVSVADLYEAAGMSASISDESYGWTSIEGARIVHDRGGFRLMLPRPHLI